MRLQLLGAVQMWVGNRLVSLGVRKQRLVMAVLGLEVNRLVPTARLVDLIWPDDPPPSARRMVHNYVSGLRAILEHHEASRHGVHLVSGQGGYVLRCDPDRVDAHRFTGLLAAARRSGDDEQRVELLERAAALARGPALAGACPEEVRVRLGRALDEGCLSAVEERAAALLRLGRHDEVVDELVGAAEQHPQRQRITAELMLALYRSGRTGDALRVYERCRQHLAEDLGLDPGPDLRRLHASILRADPELTGGGMPVPVPTATLVRPAQLPADLPSFTGRTDELGQVLALSARGPDPATPVVIAVDGMAGVGKTALAVHAAHRLAPAFPDGQVFVDLHGFTLGLDPVRPGDALDRMLRGLGVPGERIPEHLDDRSALWRSTLAGRRTLLLFDNAGGEDQVRPLLPGNPGCLVLVTSRTRLAGLDDAHLLTLDSLPVVDAVTLFGRAAGATCPAGQVAPLLVEVVELCGRLPLALRIAAARLRAGLDRTVAQLTERLRESPDRLAELEVGQRSVAATLDLSYRSLTVDQARGYRLSGLHPGVEIEPYATAALLDTSLPRAHQLLRDLVERALLDEPAVGRYRPHDLVRAHARHVAAGETEAEGRAALARLVEYYGFTVAAAVRAVYPSRRRRQPPPTPPLSPAPAVDTQDRAVAWLDTEMDNLLAVARFTAEPGFAATCARLSTDLAPHLRRRARYADATALHTHAVAAARTIGDRAGELNALVCMGHVDQATGRYEQAIRRYQQAATIATDADDHIGHLQALVGLGHAHRLAGRPDPALGSFEQAHQLAVELGDHTAAHEALVGCGHIHRTTGRTEQAVEQYHQALLIANNIANPVGQLEALWGVADVHLIAGRHHEAAEHLDQALAIADRIGHRTGELTTRQLLSQIHTAAGRHDDAVDHLERSLAIAEDVGHRTGELNALWSLGHANRARARHERAIGYYRQAHAVAREIGDRNGEFEATYGLAATLHATGHPAEALTHHETALRIAGDLDQPHDQARVHDALAHIHHDRGDTNQARNHWTRALTLYTATGSGGDAARVRSHLDNLDGR